MTPSKTKKTIASYFIAGIDIGGTSTVIGLVDNNNNIVQRKAIHTATYEYAETFLEEICDTITNFDQLSDISLLKGIGIGAPNGNYYKGTIEFAPNLRWKGIIPVVDIIRQKLPGMPVILTNDANAAAIGEMMYGDAKGKKDFIMITLGTGVGSGIVVNGELVYGHDGFAGEIGHTIYIPNGRQCGCGRKGCLETYTSASGIVKTAIELLNKKSDDSELRNIPVDELTTLHVGNAANRGDQIAIDTFDKTAEILAIKLADSAAHTSPSTIYIFGGVANAGKVLMEPLKKYFEENLLEVFKNKIQIKPSALHQNDTAILGAAALIKKAL
ncbi:MAG: ROK family protein [Bacteroidetes bacterium]|nr:ROK family protein [Bacteroidota bacterium]